MEGYFPWITFSINNYGSKCFRLKDNVPNYSQNIALRRDGTIDVCRYFSHQRCVNKTVQKKKLAWESKESSIYDPQSHAPFTCAKKNISECSSYVVKNTSAAATDDMLESTASIYARGTVGQNNTLYSISTVPKSVDNITTVAAPMTSNAIRVVSAIGANATSASPVVSVPLTWGTTQKISAPVAPNGINVVSAPLTSSATQKVPPPLISSTTQLISSLKPSGASKVVTPTETWTANQVVSTPVTSITKPAIFASAPLIAAPAISVPKTSSTIQMISTPKALNAHNIPPAKQIKPCTNPNKTRKAANKVLNRLCGIPVETLSIIDRNSLNWATNTLIKLAKTAVAQLNHKVNTTCTVIAKRAHEETVTASNKKVCIDYTGKANTHPSGATHKSSNPVAPSTPCCHTQRQSQSSPHDSSKININTLVFAVIDHSNSGGHISQRNWTLLEYGLSKVYTDVLMENPGSPPQCNDLGWWPGHLRIMSFKEHRSVMLFTKALAKLGEVWKGARLEVVPLDKIKNFAKVRTYLPAIPDNAEEIMHLIRLSNPNLATENWRVIKINTVDGNTLKTDIAMNKKSLAALSDLNSKISYGFTTIVLELVRKN